jgi:predicted kinase
MLVVISGLPGLGKTTIADLVGARLRAVRLSIDPVEEALLAAGSPRGWETGVAAYEAVGAMARLNLEAGRTVVIDAVNDSEPARETWRRAATSAGAALCWVVLTMSDTAGHASRLLRRDRGFQHVPEPTWSEVAGRQMEPWADRHRVIDVTGSSAEQIAAEVERYTVEFRANH